VPELPEVETVRRGLLPLLAGRRIEAVEVLRDRPLRRQPAGPAAFAAAVAGAAVTTVERRGKYLWWVLDGAPVDALVAHLGMSGQFRVHDRAGPAPDYRGHERVRFLLDDGRALSFVDQRTFGWLLADRLVAGPAGPVPAAVAHVALDPLDPQFDAAATAQAMRRRRTELKRALLDQTLVSGIGNIYADEALWRVRRHGRTPVQTLGQAAARAVLDAAAEVMRTALAAGGTSFDPLYVNVNGESGWFARDLAAYGREGLPCRRCGAGIVRESFMNRSSYRCRRCQRTPRGLAGR
jgi:formamidopyrimidine-DNA glycosylase